MNATGGTITYSGGYKIHTFISNGTFTVTDAGNVEALVVAGGGGGNIGENGAGDGGGGGGGGGGAILNSSYPVTNQAYTIVVGSGGANANNGTNSSFDAINTRGGGSGASGGLGASNPGKAGGSGGGGGRAGIWGLGTSGQGNNGGNSSASNGGGGGGKGGLASGRTGGVGQAYTINGTSITYSAGGYGGWGNSTNGTGLAGTNGTGNGGGGGDNGGVSNRVGGRGGDGVIIIRYLDGDNSTNSSAPTYNSSGGYDGSGAYTFDGLNDYIGSIISTTTVNTTSLWYKNSTASSWTHAVWLSNGTNFTDGILANPNQKPIYISGTTVQVGKTGASTYFNGSIDQVQIFDRALSASEVLALYNGTNNNSNYIGKYARDGDFQSLVFYNATTTYWNTSLSLADTYSNRTGVVTSQGINLSDANLVSYWTLDGKYTDEKGTNNGTATGTNNASGLSSGAMRFDGVDDFITEAGGFQTSQSWWYKSNSGNWNNYANVSGTFYINGVINTSAIVFVMNGSGIGKNSTGFVNGSIDEVAIWNKSLSASEVQAIYKAGLSQKANTNVTLYSRTATAYNLTDTGLVSQWDFNDNTANDAKGVNNGTATASVGFNEANGSVGFGSSYNGVNTHINISNPTWLYNNSAYTYSAWIRVDSSGALYAETRCASNSPRYIISAGPNIGLRLDFRNDAETVEVMNITTALVPSNQWTHVAIVRSSTTAYTFYINGIGQSLTLVNPSGATITNVQMGRWCRITSDNYFNGSIDEVRIYNRSLSASEVLDLYNLGASYINWTNSTYQSEGTINDSIAKTNTLSGAGKFFQFKGVLTTNDTNIAPFVLNHSITSTNSAPTVSSVVLNSTNTSSNETNVNLTSIISGTTDINGDNVTLIYNWYKTNTTGIFNVANTLPVNRTGLVSYWPLNNDTLDYYSTNDGTNSGATLNSSGKVGGAYSFDGVNDEITTSLQPSTGAGVFSFSLWMKTPQLDLTHETYALSWGRDDIGELNGIYVAWEYTTNNIIFDKHGSGADSLRTATRKDDGVWHHVVGTYNGTTAELFVDNTSIGTKVWTLTVQSGTFIIGNTNVSNRFFTVPSTKL